MESASSGMASFTITRLRNENKQLRNLIRELESDLDEERALRQKLEHKLEKLTNDSGRNPMSHKKVGDILNAIYSEKGGGEIMTFGKCQAGHGSVNNQELVELRAKIQLREAQFSDLKAELQRVSESMLEERGTLYERIKTLEDKNTELVNSKTKSDAVGVIIERERALTRCERTEHLAQIDSLRRIISSFRVCCSTGPGQVQQTTQEQHLLLQHQQTDPAANKRLNEAFDALLAGESEYINDLTVIDEVFKAPMDQLGEDVISKAGRNRIFSTLVVIRNQHIQLFDFLKKSLADKSKVGISQYFYNIYDLVSKYKLYSQYFETALTIIHETMKIKVFSRFLLSAESNPRCKGRTFSLMLLLPLQRVLEYPALLNAICLNFPRGHPELAILDQTRLLFLQNTAVLEENKQNAEAYIKTIELKSKISSLPQGFVVPKRRYICDDTLSLVTPDKKLAERRFFLFSDIIVETRPSSSSSKPFRMLSSMLLNDARTEDVPDGTYTNAFTLENQSFCYFILCPSPAAKFEWLQRLNETIESLKASEGSFRVFQSMTGPLHVAHSSVSYLRGKGDGAVPHCTIKLNKVGGSDSSVNGDGTKSSTGVELGVSQKKHRRPPDPVLDAKHDDNSDMLSIKSYNSYGGYDEEDKMSIKSSKSGKSAGSHHKHSKKSIKKI